jgi:histidine triad (HIT) family protein
MDCLFCKIIEGKVPSQKIFEDDKVIAIKDISPQAPIHYLFIPKAHIENLEGLTSQNLDIMTDLFGAIKSVAKKEGFGSKGYRTSINTNKEGAQSVYHLHVHCLAGRQLGGNMAGV